VDSDERYTGYPPGFFTRFDEAPDTDFYGAPRLVTHIDDGAIAAVGQLYRDLGLAEGEVLDLCSSWISHFLDRPRRLVALGLNERELAANPDAHDTVVHDLNATPSLPFDAATFDGATCCVSIDYLIHPIEVFDEVARVLRPGGVFAVTFSNRCFPTKAIAGWLQSDDRFHVALVADYFRRSGCWQAATAEHRNVGLPGDPLFAVWSRRL
jgi:SAM-dependent methyltransferase